MGDNKVDTDRVRTLVHALLLELGEDPDRDGLRDTPQRVAAWWAEFMDYDPGKLDTSFTLRHEDEMVVVRGMAVWSLCEHHLLPFSASVTVGYIPGNRVIGLSKVARIAHHRAHQLQVQERMTAEIADDVQKAAATPDVAVLVHGVHLCMSMRGIKTPATMRTSVTRGAFRDQPATRAEWLRMADQPQ